MIRLKTLLRSPVRTALTFILLGVVTLALLTQITEYAVASRERREAAKLYYGFGSVEDNFTISVNQQLSELTGEDVYEYQHLTREQVDAIAAMPYVTLADARYMTAGVSGDYERIFRRQANQRYSERRVIEGTLSYIGKGTTTLVLTDAVCLAGSLPWDHVNKYVWIHYPYFSDIDVESEDYDSKDDAGGGVHSGENNSGGVYNGKSNSGGVSSGENEPERRVYNTAYMEENLTVGERYAFVVSAEKENFKESTSARLGDDPADDWCKAIWRVDGREGSYLDSDEYEPLRTLIDIIETDIRTFDVVYTADMSVVKRFADGDMMIREGRAIDSRDNKNAAQMCVVSKAFSEANGVAVGDTISLKLGTKLFEQLSTLGALSVIHPRYAPPGNTAELEIIGIYFDTDELSSRNSEPGFNYSVNSIFVPVSLLPVDQDQLASHTFTPAEFNFKIDDARDLPAFTEECVPAFEELLPGLTLTLDDGGWLEIEENFRETEKLSFIKIAVFTAAVVLVTGFAVYLFIGRKKTEYSIMRALGSTRKKSAFALGIPLLIVTAASVLVGVIAAWLYIAGTIERSELLLSLRQSALNTSIPAEIVIGCAFGELLLTLLFALAFLRRLGAIPPLLLLQTSAKTMQLGAGKAEARARGADTAATPPASYAQTNIVYSPIAAATPPADSAGGAAGHIARHNAGHIPGFILHYIWRHLRRAAGKSILVMLLAAVLFAVVGRFALVRNSYIELAINRKITARIVGGARLSLVPKVMASGYIRESYYKVDSILELDNDDTKITITNNFSRSTGEEYTVRYAEGYNESCLGEFGNIVIVGQAFAEEHEIAPGDTISVRSSGRFEDAMIRHVIINSPMLRTHTIEELRELFREEVEQEVEKYTEYFTVAGVFSTTSERLGKTVFTPGSLDSTILISAQSVLNEVEYTLDDNLLADEFRDYCQQNVSGISSGRAELVMDTSKIDGARRTLKLLDTLNPMIYTAALVIGSVLCCIVTLQSSKEAALMRVLGTPRPLTGALLSLEQSLLTAAGLVLGACGLLAAGWFGGRAPPVDEIAEVSKALIKEIANGIAQGATMWGTISPSLLFFLLYSAVIFASAAICSAVATRRSVLALLQTRE